MIRLIVEYYDGYDANTEARFTEPGNLYNDMSDTEDTQDDVFEFYVSYCMNNCRNEDIAREYLESENIPESFIDSIIDEIYRRFDISESLKEADYGYVHDEEEAKLHTSMRSYMRRTGWVPINVDGKSYFEMDFNYGNQFCTIYVDEWGNCYLTTDGDDIRSSDMFYTITEIDNSVIDDLITLGNTITSTGDVNSALDVFFG